jgi:cytochrome c-type biogenesis protein CcmH/NrfG
VASFELEEFEAAKAAFEEAARLDPKHKQAATWIAKCDAALEGACDQHDTLCSASRSMSHVASTAKTHVMQTAAIKPSSLAPMPPLRIR